MQPFRNFQINLVAANNLENVRRFGEMKVYAKVSLNEETGTTKKTNVDTVGGLNPRWNFPVGYTISESAFTGQQGAVQVVVKLYCDRTLGDKCLGEVRIPIESVFDFWVRGVYEMSYWVAGTRYGSLDISYSFGDVFYFMEQMDRRQQSAWERALRLGLVVARQGILFFSTGGIDFGF
ncbi:protein SRC2-like [Salvia hispanica]|uniref:protein SRC2-like n=1 Tax=Salvia hispanica TaxID=49212 RepID=UPI0020094D92|nr:protein SRC2-like [Salvia hispanica]